MLTDYLMVLLIRDALEVYVAFNFSCAAVCLAATPACWLMAFPCNKEYNSFSFLYLDICGVFMIQELRCESFVLENVIEVTKWITPIPVPGRKPAQKTNLQLRKVLVMCFGFSHVDINFRTSISACG